MTLLHRRGPRLPCWISWPVTFVASSMSAVVALWVGSMRQHRRSPADIPAVAHFLFPFPFDFVARVFSSAGYTNILTCGHSLATSRPVTHCRRQFFFFDSSFNENLSICRFVLSQFFKSVFFFTRCRQTHLYEYMRVHALYSYEHLHGITCHC